MLRAQENTSKKRLIYCIEPSLRRRLSIIEERIQLEPVPLSVVVVAGARISDPSHYTAFLPPNLVVSQGFWVLDFQPV
jgi:hypothetical protein